jgi:short-subunit dehydrogenase
MANRPVALVTGASSGIGAAFARQLAVRQHDVIVVARDHERLDRLAEETTALGAAVERMAVDLTDPQQLAAVEKRLSDPAAGPVDILVNNAGHGSTGCFHELSLDDEVHQIELNVVALVRLTHAALAAMVPRRGGGILNVSSVEGFLPAPRNATYCASKAYVTSFTEAVHEEVAPDGVRVTCVCPGLTRTEFQDRAGVDVSGFPGFLWMDANAVAKAALACLDRNQALCVPGPHNRAAVEFLQVAPRAVVRRMAGRFVRPSGVP